MMDGMYFLYIVILCSNRLSDHILECATGLGDFFRAGWAPRIFGFLAVLVFFWAVLVLFSLSDHTSRMT